MRVMRDFKCEDNHITEKYIDSEAVKVICETCGKEAHKIIGFSAISLDGTDPSLPGAWNKWANVREQRHRQTMAKNRADGK